MRGEDVTDCIERRLEGSVPAVHSLPRHSYCSASINYCRGVSIMIAPRSFPRCACLYIDISTAISTM